MVESMSSSGVFSHFLACCCLVSPRSRPRPFRYIKARMVRSGTLSDRHRSSLLIKLWVSNSIENINVAGVFAVNLSLRLTEGWYALVFAAPSGADATNAVMPRACTDIGDPLYVVGTTTGVAGDAFEYHDDTVGDLNGARMFLDTKPAPFLPGPLTPFLTDAASPVPEPSAVLLLGSGLAMLGGIAWRRHRRG